jgi:hypothetical protein
MFPSRHSLFAAARLLVAAAIVATLGSVRADAQAVSDFQQSLTGNMGPGTEGVNLFFTVPTGKQLVIEYVAGNCFVPEGQTCVLSIFTQNAGSPTAVEYNLVTEGVGPFGSDEDLWRTGQAVKLYADSGTTVMLRADRNAATGHAHITFMTVSGYLQ